MSKPLNPPYIEGSIVAQSGGVLKILFRLNYSVGFNEISGMQARLKTAVTNTWMKVLLTATKDKIIHQYGDLYEVTFSLPSGLLNIGQHYKIQLAFLNNSNVVGYYSSVGVFKYTAPPAIQDLQI
jgi:hypothetical protein